MSGYNGMNGSNGNGFNFNGRRDGTGPGDDSFEEDEDHEHVYVNIVQTPNVSAYEEQVHQVISLEFHDRGLSLDFNLEEAEELGEVLAEVMRYLKRKGAIEP